MNNDGRGCPLLRCNVIFVGPASVISHGAAAEHFLVQFCRIIRIGNWRIVDQHQKCFSTHIDVFVIIPAVFGRDDAVTDKNDI